MSVEIYDFTRYRTSLGFQKSKKYLKWMKEKYPNRDLHHILGSVHNLKFTDYLVVAIDHSHHLNEVERRKGFYFNVYFAEALANLCLYAKTVLKMRGDEINYLLINRSPEQVNKLIEAISKKENEGKT